MNFILHSMGDGLGDGVIFIIIFFRKIMYNSSIIRFILLSLVIGLIKTA